MCLCVSLKSAASGFERLHVVFVRAHSFPANICLYPPAVCAAGDEDGQKRRSKRFFFSLPLPLLFTKTLFQGALILDRDVQA